MRRREERKKPNKERLTDKGKRREEQRKHREKWNVEMEMVSDRKEKQEM